MKTGRNSPCPCGSGKKYKRCCIDVDSGHQASALREIPPQVLSQFRAQAEKEEIRRKTYGDVRPIIHENFQGHKLVAVGNQLHYSKNWKTFPDFLFQHVPTVLGKEWGERELEKPLEQRHQILQWHDGVIRFRRQQKPGTGEIYSVIPNGITSAYLHLAYDLYVVRDNAKLQAEVVKRLKNKEKFQGARYELFVAATCVRAGYKIAFEDESDAKTKHPEFIGTHIETGQKIAVEAKSRHRKGHLGFPGEKKAIERLGVENLLRNALKKTTIHPFVIFVDLNVPPSPGQFNEKPWFNELGETAERFRDASTGCDPFNLIVFTNHPHHQVPEHEPDPSPDTISIFSQRPQVAVKHPEALLSIHDAALQYPNIPNEFPDR